MQQGIDLAIERANGQTALAERIGSTSNMVWQWAHGKRPISAPFCVKIERQVGVSRRALRPTDWGDIWPELIDAEHPWPPVAELTQESA
jgi:DNA-binding transcriptional regulator YdaS (Cro superfamily)